MKPANKPKLTRALWRQQNLYGLALMLIRTATNEAERLWAIGKAVRASNEAERLRKRLGGVTL